VSAADVASVPAMAAQDAGAWGQDVQHYRAALRVFAGDLNRTSIVQWSSEFDYPTDAISTFYENGFRALRAQFPLKATE
jgi:hypothetical protein